MKFVQSNLLCTFAGVALLASGAAQAHDASSPMTSPVPACSFSGFYLGGAAGYDMTEDRVNYRYKAAFGGGGNPVDDAWNNDFGLNGFRGGMIAGWGKEFSNRFYVGLDANYLFGNSKSKKHYTVNGQETRGEFKKEDSWGVGLRFGKVFNNTLVYLYGGYASAKFKAKIISDTVSDVKENDDLDGFAVGGGMDMKLSQNVMIGLNYTYTDFGKWKGGRNAINKLGLPVVSDDNHTQYKHDFQSHNVMLRVAYTF